MTSNIDCSLLFVKLPPPLFFFFWEYCILHALHLHKIIYSANCSRRTGHKWKRVINVNFLKLVKGNHPSCRSIYSMSFQSVFINKKRQQIQRHLFFKKHWSPINFIPVLPVAPDFAEATKRQTHNYFQLQSLHKRHHTASVSYSEWKILKFPHIDF